MFKDMSQATWKPLGTVTQRVAAKLIALREVQDKRGGHVGAMLDNVTASCPDAREERLVKVTSAAGDTNGGGLARPNLKGEAVAEPVRRAMQASGEIDGAHDLRPLLPSKSSTTTSPEADKRVRSSQ